jgi:hypothetical protein
MDDLHSCTSVRTQHKGEGKPMGRRRMMLMKE